ncbi:homocitrate synthase/isopropylmalate synthase family protein [Streptococcus hyovaginalis]
MKEKPHYEIISPELGGYVNNNNMVRGKHSGSHAFKTKLNELGLRVNDEDVKDLFMAFKDLAEHKKEISDEDIIAIVLEKKLAKEEEYYEFVAVTVQHKNEHEAEAKGKLFSAQNERIIQQLSLFNL